MLGLGSRTFRRYMRLFFCVCLFCFPPVHFAKVFPNHLVPRLTRSQRDSYRYEETADSNSDSPRLLLPPSRVSSLSRNVLSPMQTSLIPFSYPYILQKSVYGNERILRQLYNGQDSPRQELSQTVLLDAEEALESPVYDSILPDDEFLPSALLGTDQWLASKKIKDQPVSPTFLDDPLIPKITYQDQNPINYYDYMPEEELYGPSHKETVAEKLYKPKQTAKYEHDRSQLHKKPYHKSSSSENAQKPATKPQTPCRYCRLRQEDRNHRIESLKRKILQKLNMTSFPNRTGRHVPKALVHMAGIGPDLLRGDSFGQVQHQQYYQDGDGPQVDSEGHPVPKRIIVLAKTLPVILHSGAVENVTYFPMPKSVLQSKVTKADLWFYVNRTTTTTTTTATTTTANSADDGSRGLVKVTVDLLAPSPLSKRRPHPHHHHLNQISFWQGLADPEKDNGWHMVDLTQIIQGWARDPGTNHGLRITASDGQGSRVLLHPTKASSAAASSGTAADKGYEPTLDIVSSHKDSRQRHKRSDSLICTDNSTEHRCCRYPLSLSFMDYQWEWVIAPLHMEVGYCSGECHMTLQNETPHSWLIAQARSAGSCCTPSKMMAMPLLYFNHEGDIVHQLLQDMRVERCGCA